jgi:flagellar motor switch/type III secretory pathway protein FliN
MTALPTSSSHDYSYYYDPPPQQAPYYQQAYAQRKKQQQQANEDNDGSQCVPSTSVQMLEILMRENSNLRAELANARMKIQTIHKVN